MCDLTLHARNSRRVGCIVNSLLAKLCLNCAKLAIDVAIQIEDFTVGICVGISEFYFCFELCDSCALCRLVTIDEMIFGTSRTCAATKDTSKVAAENLSCYRTDDFIIVFDLLSNDIVIPPRSSRSTFQQSLLHHVSHHKARRS